MTTAGDTPPLPTLALDPATLADLDADLAREWLVTNGLGGYAMGTLCGATTRSYHGLLVAAVRPPVDRAVLITKVDEMLSTAEGATLELGTNEYADGTIAPRGFERLSGFALEGLVPCWTYRVGPRATLEKRVWMEHGHNVTFVQYRYRVEELADAANAPVTLALAPFCLDRDHHGCTRGAADWRFLVEAEPSACTVRAFEGALPYRLVAGPDAAFQPGGDWYWNVLHRAERARGLPAVEDVYQPGRFRAALAPGATLTLVLSAESPLPDALTGLGGAAHETVAGAALRREHERCCALLAQAGGAIAGDELAARLALAADQFLVARPALASEGVAAAGAEPSVTVIAGYPWFTDWGRDTMIALPGLTLATRRFAEARGLLRTFARYLDQGMLPNRFPDGGAAPEYNTVDATFWYFQALSAYLEATSDDALLEELFDPLAEVITWHVRGTRFGIGVDSADGLLRAGAPGVQLTWMDARAGDWVVTPRRGKPVEVNALWYAALVLMASWARRLGRDADRYETLRAAVERSFFPAYWYPAGGYLCDVVDVEGQAGARDWSLRPNQLLALALAPPLVPRAEALTALQRVEETLLTPVGLRTLAPEDPRYQGVYAGDQRTRDAAYHQGTVWPWLLGAYASACRWLYGTAWRVEALLPPLDAHLREAGVGSVSEIFAGDPPHTPCGCIAQAWSVAEALRLAVAART
jgi:predicted glycogen debranching enzyme